ncbi:MAG: response regulator [Methanoregula sp.]|jgi:DNA-binding NarL/FixJ family response regulator
MNYPLKIFYIEDDEQLADLLDIRLKKLGYQVCGHADNAASAVTGVLTSKPDLALVDIELHGKFEGLVIGDYLLSYTDIPFVYMTGYDDMNILEQARRTVPDGFLLKPFDDRQLRVAVEMAIRND